MSLTIKQRLQALIDGKRIKLCAWTGFYKLNKEGVLINESGEKVVCYTLFSPESEWELYREILLTPKDAMLALLDNKKVRETCWVNPHHYAYLDQHGNLRDEKGNETVVVFSQSPWEVYNEDN